MYYDQIKLLKQGVEKARGLLGDAIDVVPGLGTVNQGLLAAENIGRGNLAGAAENIQNLVPTGKIAGRAIKALTKGKGQSEVGGLLNIDAYHGTPHVLQGNKFDSKKIGTGEGAQAYGYGGYLAQAKGTGEEYKRILGQNAFSYNGETVDQNSDLQTAMEYLAGQQMNKREAIADAAGNPKLQRLIKSIDPSKVEQGGSLYRVNLPDDKISRMLDWDASISSQPALQRAIERRAKANVLARKSDEVRTSQPAPESTGDWMTDLFNPRLDDDARDARKQAARMIQQSEVDAEKQRLLREWLGPDLNTDASGKQLYKKLSEAYTPEIASKMLMQVGVPGIKYEDQLSRNYGGQTQNFVVFPGELEQIKVLERNGQALGIQGGLLDSNTDSSLLNRYQAPQDEALALAQKRAALPVSEGGLGLPPDNTPMDRAKAMGYVTPGYHGTGQDVPYFDLSRQVNGDRSGAGVYTGSASKASGYAVGESPNVMPLLMRGKVMRANDEPLSNDASVKLSDYVNNTMSEGDRARFALDAGSGRKTQYFDAPQDASDFFESQRKNWEYFGGYDRTFPEVVQDGDRFGVSYTPFGSGVDLSGATKRQVVDALRSSGSGNIAPALRGAGYDILDTGGEKVTFDPTMVRSRFAAFDPFRRNEADLLALQGGQYTPQDLLGFERMMGLLGE